MSNEDKSTLSYDPNDAPKPLTNPDWYARASLIEQRATRRVLTQLVEFLQELLTNANEEKPNKAKK